MQKMSIILYLPSTHSLRSLQLLASPRSGERNTDILKFETKKCVSIRFVKK